MKEHKMFIHYFTFHKMVTMWHILLHKRSRLTIRSRKDDYINLTYYII